MSQFSKIIFMFILVPLLAGCNGFSGLSGFQQSPSPSLEQVDEPKTISCKVFYRPSITEPGGMIEGSFTFSKDNKNGEVALNFRLWWLQCL